MKGFVSALLFFCVAKGVSSFSVTTSNPDVGVDEKMSADLTCSYSADFGSDARVEWKFKDRKGSTSLVVYQGKPTGSYVNRITFEKGGNLRFSEVTRADTGEYTCEVSSTISKFESVLVKLTVRVATSVPLCIIPQSVTSGTRVSLFCSDPEASPPPTHKWFRDGTLMPEDPSKLAAFKNSSYKLDSKTGELMFPSASLADSAQYYCEVFNNIGPAQRCKGLRMDVRNLNTGGIAAGVIIFLLLLVLVVVGLWFAHRKGYLCKKEERSSMPQRDYKHQPIFGGGGVADEDGDFKQKSSFVV